MHEWSSATIALLTFLLPGFLSAAVYFSLTSVPKPPAFERVIQALIFTTIVHAIGALCGLSGIIQDLAQPNSIEFSATVGIALLLGALTAVAVNTDALHTILRHCRITRETAYPTEWYAAFAEHPNSYVVLHMTRDRRLYGWPSVWPSRPDEGHFIILNPEWLTRDDKRHEAGETIAVPITDVELVEFVRSAKTEHSRDGDEADTPPAAASASPEQSSSRSEPCPPTSGEPRA